MVATNERKTCKGQIDSVRKARLVCIALPHSGPSHALRMSVLTGFLVRLADVRENTWAIRWDKQNCPS